MAASPGDAPPLDQEEVTADLLESIGDGQPARIWMETMARLQFARVAYSATRLGLLDQLSGEARSAEALGALTGCPEAGVYRLLRALCVAKLTCEPEPGLFALTDLGAMLRSGERPSFGEQLVDFFEPPLLPLDGLIESVRTGRPAFEHRHGVPFYTYFETTAADGGARFDASMNLGSRLRFVALAEQFDFESVETVADLGGGEGFLLAQLLFAFPHLRGILQERGETARRAEQRLEKWAMTEQCRTIVGDFFEDAPPGADAYILSFVLHNWRDEECERILQSCRMSMPPHAHLLIVEQLRDRMAPATLEEYLDLTSLELLRGRERSAVEFLAMLARADFAVTAIGRSASSPFTLIQARPAPR
jgi:hypothetical protein